MLLRILNVVYRLNSTFQLQTPRIWLDILLADLSTVESTYIIYLECLMASLCIRTYVADVRTATG
jgi:hypothetical protein